MTKQGNKNPPAQIAQADFAKRESIRLQEYPLFYLVKTALVKKLSIWSI